jgi:hypothetical protein
MIFRNGSAWVKSAGIDDSLYNLDYVYFIKHEQEGASDQYGRYYSSDFVLHFGKEIRDEFGEYSCAADEKEYDVIQSYLYQGNRKISAIGNSAWVSHIAPNYLINLSLFEPAKPRDDAGEITYRAKPSKQEYMFDWENTMANMCLENIFGEYYTKLKGDYAEKMKYINPLKEEIRQDMLLQLSTPVKDTSKWKCSMRELLGEGITIINASPEEIELMKASFDQRWTARELQEILARDGAAGDKGSYMNAYENSMILTETAELQGMEDTQKKIANFLIKLSTEHDVTVCVAGADMKDKSPHLLERIMDYNRSILAY